MVALRDSLVTSREVCATGALTNLQVKATAETKQARCSIIAHSDGIELMKIVDVGNDLLTTAKQQGHTDPSRLIEQTESTD